MLKIIYDFDGTLTTSELPKYHFISKIGLPVDNKELMKTIYDYAKSNNLNIYQSFYELVINGFKENNFSFDDSFICEDADKLKYQKGLKKYLEYFKEDAEHYIVTSGYQNYIFHTKIKDYFKGIYGTTFDYVDDTVKIKELVTDDVKIKKIDMIAGNDFEDIVYIGDGLTDAPAFKYVSEKGGISILIGKKDTYDKLSKMGIKVLLFKPDYSEGSSLFNFIDDLVYLEKCLKFTKFKHGSQKRKQGTPYYKHPLAVAIMLREKGFDVNYQAAGLFHDLLEDTQTTNEEIFNLSNDDVLEAVILVTKEKGYDMKDYISRIIACDMARMVKLADRIHNLNDSENSTKLWQKKYYKETIDWYIPLAKGTPFEEDFNEALEKMKNRIQK